MLGVGIVYRERSCDFEGGEVADLIPRVSGFKLCPWSIEISNFLRYPLEAPPWRRKCRNSVFTPVAILAQGSSKTATGV